MNLSGLIKKAFLFTVCCGFFFTTFGQTWHEDVRTTIIADQVPSTSISGDFAVIGCYGYHYDETGNNYLVYSGAVFLLYRHQGGYNQWGILKTIVASDRAEAAFFGYSVSIDGEYLAVGAPYEQKDGFGLNPLDWAGAVYLYKRNLGGPDNWGELTKITSSDRATDDRFGSSVSISGDYLVAGAPAEDEDAYGTNPLSCAGSAYIFYKNQGGPDKWREMKKIVASNRSDYSWFGGAISIHKNKVIVGKDPEYSGYNENAYIFYQNAGGTNNWGEVKILISDDYYFGDRFGSSVDIDDEFAVVGSYQRADSVFTDDAGAAYIFEKDLGEPDNWGQIKRLESTDNTRYGYFGKSVSKFGTSIIIGAPGEGTDESGGNDITGAGAAYIFLKDIGGLNNWGLAQKIVPTERTWYGNFGTSVFLDSLQGIAGSQIQCNNPCDWKVSGHILKRIFQAENIGFSNIHDNQVKISWEQGTGSRRIVFIHNADTGCAVPKNRTTYLADSVFGDGSWISLTNWYCVYNDTGSSVTVTGLTPETTYRAMVCEYTGQPGFDSYCTLTAPGNPANFTTAMDLSGVGLHVANGLITNVNTLMQYSLNSTDGSDGDWTDCPDGDVSVTFAPGKVWIRETAISTNFRLLADLKVGPAPTFSINYMNETTAEVIPDAVEYNADNDFESPNMNGTNIVIPLIPAETVYFRYKISAIAFASEVQTLAIPVRPFIPVLTIDFRDEETVEAVMTNIEYNTDHNFVSPNDTGTGIPLALIPGTDIYYRVKATDSNFVSGIDTLIVPARPVAPVYSIDYFSEATNEPVNPEYEFSDTIIMKGLQKGSGTEVSLIPGKDLYFRRIATVTSFSGEIFHLVVPERPDVPIVSLDDRNSPEARFKKSADGTGLNVLLTDGYEYSLDDGQSWNVIDDNITVDATGIQNIKVRQKATGSSFASLPTWNMDIDPPPKVWFLTKHICKNDKIGLLIYTDIGRGLAYLVLDGEPQADTSDLRLAAEAGNGAMAIITMPGTGILFPVTDLPEGLYFAYAVDTFGTMSAKGAEGIHVYDPPIVYFPAVDDACDTDGPLTLPTGMPDGGDYSGSAVIDGSFIPELAGPGEHQVIYTYKDTNGCTGSYSRLIKVVKPPDINFGPDRKICRGTELELDAGTGFKTYYWSPGGLVTRKIVVSEAGDYEVIAITKEGCESSDDITISVQDPYQDEKICMVTVDLQTGKNMIVWEKTPGVGTAYYAIYRETAVSGNYIPIGTVPYNNLSVFIDAVAEPEKQPFLYKLSLTDSCGNESEMSPYHKTLFLQYSPSHEGNNLSWREYNIENGDINFLTYEIYRGSSATGLQKIEEVSSNVDVYTDTDPDALKKVYYYRLGGVKSIPCYPSSVLKAEDDYSRSISNIVDNRYSSDQVRKNELSGGIKIVPNPFQQTTTLYFDNPKGHSYNLCITDLSGKLCRLVNNINTSEYLLEKGDLKEGFYFIELHGDKIYRGKIMVD